MPRQQTIQIYHSENTATPSALFPWELAFSANSGKLFIGGPSDTVVPIGGAQSPGQATANQAIVLDTNSHIDTLQTSSLRITSSGVSNTSYIGVSANLSSISGNNILVSSEAVINYISGVMDSTWEGDPVAVEYGGTGRATLANNAVLVGANIADISLISGSSGNLLQVAANGSVIFSTLDGGTY